MGNDGLIKFFESVTYLSKGTRIQRLGKAPIKIIYSKFLKFFSTFFSKPIKTKAKTFWNDEMTIIVPESVSFHIYRYNFYEEGLTRMLLEFLKNGMVFIDVGAHFGYFTLLASRIVGDNGQVHSFEPTPSTFEILRENTQKRSNIYINNMAVFSKRTKMKLNDYGILYSASNSLYNPRLKTDIVKKLKHTRYDICTTSIDEYVRCKNINPHFIKIDAESSEYEILKGMKKTIQDFHPIISIEVGDYEVEGIPRSKELNLYLMDYGYEPYVYNVSEEKIIKHKLKERYTYDNILFMPKLYN